MAFTIPGAITNNINKVADIEGYLSVAGTISDIARNFLPSEPSIQENNQQEILSKNGRKFSTDNLRGLIQDHGGLAAQNRFQVELPDIAAMKTAGPDNGLSGNIPMLLSFDRAMLCTAGQLPGKTIGLAQRQIGIENRAVSNGQTFTEVTLTFYLTNSYAIRKYFQYWMECIVSQSPGQPMVAGYYKNYVKDIVIKQLDQKGNTLYSVQLIDAFPTNLEMIQLNNQAQTAAMEMTVGFSYRNYKTT